MYLDLILEPDLSPAQIKELGLLAEARGFRGIWTQNYSAARDALMSLVPLAQASSRILLGAVIYCPYEMHPIKIANAILTLNEFARGRAMIVVGSGGEWPEIMMSSVFHASYANRIGPVRETLQILQRIRTRKAYSHRGQHFAALRYQAEWHKCPGPMIYHGACGPKMLAMGAEIADGCMMSDVMPEMATSRFQALAPAANNNPDFRISNFVAWHIRKDRRESLAEARRELIIRGWLERDWLEPYLDQEDTQWVLDHRWPFLQAWLDKTGELRDVPAEIADTLVEKLSLAGDFSDIDRHTERLWELEAIGFTEIALRLHERPDESIKVISDKVLPVFDTWPQVQ
jgi:alkanesulfonate monooxygenase SsuD/methylene tetrahydromethanopterin reductase-like flavin-dependent oxidoreductase (luciferase family)